MVSVMDTQLGDGRAVTAQEQVAVVATAPLSPLITEYFY